VGDTKSNSHLWRRGGGSSSASAQKRELHGKTPTFIMFQCLEEGDYGILKQQTHYPSYGQNRHYRRLSEQKPRLYHLSPIFNAETRRTRAFCNLFCWIDWTAPIETLTTDGLISAITHNIHEEVEEDRRGIRVICKECRVGLANLLLKQEQQGILPS
jgi:hypothetical protein